MTGDLTSETDELTVFALAFLTGRGTPRDRARIRRELLAGACERARRECPQVRILVDLITAARAAPAAPDRDTPGVVVPFTRPDQRKQ